MDVEFAWVCDEQYYGHGLFPVIYIHSLDDIREKLFLAFLGDHGGMRYDVYIPIFIVLRDQIRMSKFDAAVNKSCCTESWCAEVKGDVTSISFAYDESYDQNMDTEIFYRVLCEWIDFVQQGPGQDGDSPVKKFTV